MLLYVGVIIDDDTLICGGILICADIPICGGGIFICLGIPICGGVLIGIDMCVDDDMFADLAKR